MLYRDFITQWGDSKNNTLKNNGTVYYRSGSNGDWYGVLRGASNSGVPGILVEHAFHTVPVIRKYVNQKNLSDKWAVCDAEGILKGYKLIG